MAEYPGVRLGQRGGLYDLYQYYLGGGDQVTDAPVSTVNTTQFIQPVSGGQGEGQVGGGYVPEYLPRDAQGFQIQPESPGSGIFAREYQPNENFAEYFSGVKGTPSFSGFVEEEEDNLLDRTKSFFDNSGIGSFARTVGGAIGGPFIKGMSYLSRIGRPADAIYSYGGDQTGFGSRAALTAEEVRNMEFLEAMGGVNELGQDKYGINTVSAFGNYTAYNEKRVGELNEALLNAQKKYGGKTDLYFDRTNFLRQELKDRTALQESIEADEEQTAAEIDAKNRMTLDDAYLTSKIKPTTAIDTYKEQLGATDNAGITQTITTPSGGNYKDAGVGGPAGQGTIGGGVAFAGNTAPSTSRGPAGGATTGGGGGGAAAGMGGGSQQATSAGSTNSGRSDGGWGWKDGGLVTRKPYGDGGIVDLL